MLARGVLITLTLTTVTRHHGSLYLQTSGSPKGPWRLNSHLQHLVWCLTTEDADGKRIDPRTSQGGCGLLELLGLGPVSISPSEQIIPQAPAPQAGPEVHSLSEGRMETLNKVYVTFQKYDTWQ